MTAESQEVTGLYEQHAADFDRLRDRGLMERPWLDRFIALLPQKASVLDIGCGAAEPIARYVIDAGHDVTGVDASSSLIHMCRQRFRKTIGWWQICGDWCWGDDTMA